jgi:hypothetical protein
VLTCWGADFTATALGFSSTPLDVPGLVAPLPSMGGRLGAGPTACVAEAAGVAKCLGVNWYGQLGDGSGTNSPTPVLVAGLGTARSIATGYVHSCALLANHSVTCWGNNSLGQLGDGSALSPAYFSFGIGIVPPFPSSPGPVAVKF